MGVYEALGNISVNSHWLITTNLVMGALLLLWILRYFRLSATARESEWRNTATVENLAEGFYRTSVDGKQLYANAALVKINGYDSAEEMLANVNDIASEWYVDPGRREEFRAVLAEHGSVSNFVSQVYRHKTREPIWISENARIVRNPRNGQVEFYEGSIREITAEMERQKLEKQLEKLAHNLSGGLYQLQKSPAGHFSCTYASPGFERLLGKLDTNTTRGLQTYVDRMHPDDASQYLTMLDRSARTMEIIHKEIRYRQDDQSWKWIELTATPEKLEDGSIVWHGSIQDITARKSAEEQVHQLAFFDPLTELPNRRVFTQRLEQMIGACRRRKEHGAVLFIDLDNFKSLNDTHGHETGDELLRQVAKRLKQGVRSTDTVSRFGGDEFVLLLDSLGCEMSDAISNATGAANKILREFSTGFDLGTIEHATTPSIGVVVFDGTNRNATDIIKSADIAMYEAKKGGRNSFVIFDPENLDNVSDMYLLQRDLAAAIRNEELVFEYQPQVDVNGRILGAEALVRWNHPERGLLAPSAFVPMAEKTGLIMDINEWVLTNAITTLSRWAGKPEMAQLNLSVNLSVQQFRLPEFVDKMKARIGEAGIDAKRLTLELTEHVMARDPKRVAENMAELRKTGIRFSLDDFGTGYSSLSQLNQFPFNEVKIDGAFVSDIEHRESNRSLIEAILGMAQALELETVAEHVGSPFQVEFLRERGCNLFQGFYFHPPVSEQMLESLTMEQTLPARQLRVVAS
ncbi:MAG: EAL domain-containing protein [Nitratireductor sp.]